ncbi:DedA family protein [Pseudonocardia sp. CA-107938]|uniref:DedA family protein n=1 Tax=Pseudonocardia sp. CA-107938 TaxID=3240021 RepID=UPI003D8A3228
MDLSLVLHSPLLLPTLAVLVLLDAPFPMVPSEAALMSAFGLAVGAHEWWLIPCLVLTAFAGAISGDVLMWRLGRTTRKLPDVAPTAWISGTVRERPGAVLVGARFVPAGRLVSTLAAGRAGVPFGRYLPWASLTSAAWAVYMLLAGLVIAPLVGGDPVRAFVAGLVMAAVLGGAVAVVRWVKQRWQRRPVHPDVTHGVGSSHTLQHV